MKLKALVFDTGGTVLDWHGGLVAQARRLGAARGVELDWHAFVNAWDAIISCEMIGVYKPQPQAYATAARWLALQPAQILMVACHNFDLNAAHAAGFRTAFVRRPDEWGPEGPPDPKPNRAYDFVVEGFDALAEQVLGAIGTERRELNMESIYYVMAWACHRRCKHCYEERFRPYVRGALDTVVAEAVRNFPRIVDHFPERMTLHRPGRRARCRGAVPAQDRPRGAVGRRVAARRGARERHLPGDRAAAAALCRPRRREGGGADHRRPAHRPHRRRAAGARHLHDLGGQRRRLPCRAGGRSEAARLHGPAVRAVPAPRHAPLRPAGDHAQLA